MIARIFPAAVSFQRVCRYVWKDEERAEVLEQEGIREYDHRLMAEDFETFHDLKPGRQKVVFHAVLDFHPDEKPDNAKMVEIARKYLAEIGRDHTQYVIVRHTDTPHAHVHIVANRINYDGEFINGYPERIKSKEAVQKLVKEYDLIPAQKKNLQHTNRQALNGREKRVYKIYQHITDNLPGCTSLDELAARLVKCGIDTRYRYNEQTGQREGISFRLEKYAFKGSRIDQAFSLQRLEETLKQQQQLAIWERQQLTLRNQQEGIRQKTETGLYEQQEKELTQSQRQNPGEEGEEEHVHKHSHRLRMY